jgi:tetratricopeptide (TPR) repeat protein
MNFRPDSTLLARVSAALLAVGVTSEAVAQIRQQYPGQVQQDGRLFEANPMVGSGGRNPTQAFGPPMLGNAAAQGTLGRGQSLRTAPFGSVGSPYGGVYDGGYGPNVGSGLLGGGGAPNPGANIGVQDINTLRAALGSGALANFRRDSVSVADAGSPYQGLTATPYYDPSRTVPTGGFLSTGPAYQQNFASGAYGGQVVDPRIDPRLQIDNPLLGGVVGLPPGAERGLRGLSYEGPSFQPRNSGMDAYRSSSMEALLERLAPTRTEPTGASPRTIDELAAQSRTPGDLNTTGIARSPAAAVLLDGSDPGMASEIPIGSVGKVNRGALPIRLDSQADLFDPRIGGVASAQREDPRLSNYSDPRTVGNYNPQVAQAYATGQLPLQQPDASQWQPPPTAANASPWGQQQQMASASPWAQQQQMASASPWSQQPPGMYMNPPGQVPAYGPTMQSPVRALPGNDLFSDMQIVATVESDPSGAAWYDQMRRAIRSSPNAAAALMQAAQMDAEQFVNQMRSIPIRSFARGDNSHLNDTIARAEAQLEAHDYFAAVRTFEAARSLDPENPLPLLGQGHAQLAAGEFLSAANSIIRGLEQFPQIANFRLDLTALLGDAETVDIRRSELIERLERRENVQLRFLLGYLEYFGGRREAGLGNLKRAAEGAPAGSIIGRFPALLRGAGDESGSSSNSLSSRDGRGRGASGVSPRYERNPWQSYTPETAGLRSPTGLRPIYDRRRSPGVQPIEDESDSPAVSWPSSRAEREPAPPDDNPAPEPRTRRGASRGDGLEIPKPRPLPVNPK